jgi:hypothetical protein
MSPLRILQALVILVSASGCGLTAGPKVRLLSAHTAPPAEVKLVVSVHDSEGAVSYLDATSFAVQENDVELDPAESPVSLGDPREITVETLVVFDESKARDPVLRRGLERGLEHIVESLTPHSRVVLLGYRGDERLHPRGQFERSPSPPPDGGVHIAPEAYDNARNLNGAVLEALNRIEDGRRKNTRYQAVLVVIAFGADTSGRVTAETLRQKAMPDWNALFGAEPEAAPLNVLDGADGIVKFTSEDLAMRLLDLATLVRNHLSSTYLIRYCSSARAGTRKISVRVHYEGRDGTARGGLVSTRDPLDVSQFRAGCQIGAPPSSSSKQGSARLFEESESTERAQETEIPAPHPAASTEAARETEPPPSSQVHPSRAGRPPRREAPSPPAIIAPPSGENYR